MRQTAKDHCDPVGRHENCRTQGIGLPLVPVLTTFQIPEGIGPTGCVFLAMLFLDGFQLHLETLTREIKAELSVDIRPDTTKPYGVFEAQAHGKAEGVVVSMTC